MGKINIIITLLMLFGCTKEESININDSDEFPSCGQGYYTNSGKCYENECITERGCFIDDGVNGRFNRTEIRVQQNIDTNKIVGICSAFYLSLVSYCGDGVDSTLLNIQNNIIINLENILRAPNTDLLIEPQHRLPDNCHFSLLGYQQFSDMWVNCIINKSRI